MYIKLYITYYSNYIFTSNYLYKIYAAMLLPVYHNI